MSHLTRQPSSDEFNPDIHILASTLPQFHTSLVWIRNTKMSNISLSESQEHFLYSYIFMLIAKMENTSYVAVLD